MLTVTVVFCGRVGMQSSVLQDDGGSSKVNPAEAQMLMRVVVDLVRRGGISPTDVGIVTPYAAQVFRYTWCLPS